MILDRLENASLYKQLSPRIAKGIEYIKTTDLVNIASGKYDISEGLIAMVNEYNTKDVENCKLESHRKYIDIQFIIKGEEFIGYAPLKSQSPFAEYDDVKDLIFYTNKEASLTKLEEGMFAIYFPDDLHMPGVKYIKSSLVKKLVVKVLI